MLKTSARNLPARRSAVLAALYLIFNEGYQSAAGSEYQRDDLCVEALRLDGWDWVFLDGPPAFLTIIDDMVQAVDFVVVRVKPSLIDLLATQDAVVMTKQAGTDFAVLINDAAPREKVSDEAMFPTKGAATPQQKATIQGVQATTSTFLPSAWRMSSRPAMCSPCTHH